MKEEITQKECEEKFHRCQAGPEKPCMCDCHRCD